MLKVLTGVLEKKVMLSSQKVSVIKERRKLKSLPRIVVGMTDPKTLGWAAHVTRTKETERA
jgi:hypothetical protein